MSGRLAIIGLTTLAFLALGAVTSAVPTTATAEFRVPGLFTGKKVVKRKRVRRARPAKPVRNPDRNFAALSAKAVSPAVAKNSDAALTVGTVSMASVSMALPKPTRVAAIVKDEAESGQAEADSAAADDTKAAETAQNDDKTAAVDATKDTASENSGTDSDATTESSAEDKAEPKDDREGDTIATDESPAESNASEEKSADANESDDPTSAASATGGKEANTESAEARPAEATSDAETADERTAKADTDETPSAAKQSETASNEDESRETADKTESAKADPSEQAADASAAEDKSTDDALAKSDDAASEESTDTASADTDLKPSEAAETNKKADASPDTQSADARDDDPKEAVETAAKAAAAVTAAGIAAKAANDDTAESKDTEAEGSNGSTAAADGKDSQSESTETTDTKTAGASDAEGDDTKTADATATKPDEAKAKDDSAEAEGPKDVADSAQEDADKAEAPEGEIITASLPPAPLPKPEIARMASPANDPENLAKAATDAQEPESPADKDSDVTASISPSAGTDGLASSDVSADVTDVTRKSGGTQADDTLELDPRAYDATVVLNVSPPPSGKGTDGEETEVAALTPGSEPQSGDVEAADDGAAEKAVDLGPPPPPPVDPVIASVRSMLDGSQAPKVAAADLEALKTLYGERDDNPLWVSGDELTPEAKVLIATIRDADDWGLDAKAYKLPSPENALNTDEAKASAELTLSAAVLRYARHAQTGRLTPSKAHKLFDFHPKARDPKTVLTEISASDTPDKKLLSLHPQNEQYQRLHAALVHARDSAKDLGRNPENDRTVQLIVINMERWRWLPSDLGNFHVWNNIPEFKFRVLKGGREIYEEKTIVGQTKYATAFFSAPMRNIVFNPNWTVPPTIVREDIAPKLKGPQRSGGLFGGRESRNRMLRRYGLSISKGGKPVDADSVDWQTANVHTYTFQQDPGPHNVLGRFKFNFPNKHAIYMHDTTQKELFGRSVRTLSHGCIRVNQPTRFAAFLLAEDKGWSMADVQDVFAKAQGQTKFIALRRNISVHLTYNTAIADSYGSIREYGDVYGIDGQMAAKLFKNPAHFAVPFSGGEIAETDRTRRYSDNRPRRRRSAGGVDNFLSGLLGN